ncbi:pentapeptide repeat-containing protein [Arthrobacter sp. MPF02]|uniref:pentapeptide repeat-containing protein n=1 Tax=Arthrobacter sp. MPF02 TaxID=3388492 RepID=UPI00398568A7
MDGLSRFLRRARLSTAVLAAVIVAAATAFVAYGVLQRVLPTGSEAIQPKDLTQFSLAIVAGVGGVVALVVAYRRQQGTEESRFIERFSAAASQLGDLDPAVRMAGVYAMAGAADEASGHERQQCIDVLCGYLRLPYSPAIGANHESELQDKVSTGNGNESTHRYLYRQNDREVRQTIVRVIAAHLQETARESWSRCDLDFRGAIFEDADFQGARFAGARTLFDRAQFTGVKTSFVWTRFRNVSFDRAVFAGEKTLFLGALFYWYAQFESTDFCAGKTTFADARFECRTKFDGAKFSGGETSFSGAAFGTGGTTFRGCDFGEGQVDFAKPAQWDPAPTFDWDGKSKPPNVLPKEWPPE